MPEPRFRDTITHAPLVVSDASTNVINRALVAAFDAGAITEHEYAMTYAEVCEPGKLPQAHGGFRVDPDVMTDWQEGKPW
jgi:hypothetical protein